MLIKFLLGIAIVAFTSFCGYLFSGKYRKRSLFFRQLNAFNERFLTEISYYRRPIGEFATRYSYNGEFNTLLQDFLKSLSDSHAWQGLNKSDYSFLKKEEKRIIEDYFLMLGKGNSTSQKAYFSSMKDSLSSMYNEAKCIQEKYGNLYIKIGFLCGLLILILIV